MLQLRPYQTQIVDEIRDALRRGINSPLVVSPTGSGKTAIFSHIAAGARNKKNRVLVLVHRQEILNQTLKSMYQAGVTAGQIVSGKPMTSDLIQVASVQTLVRRLSLAKRPDLIIVDEAHHAVEGNSWGKIVGYWKTVPRIGFSATPERLDGQGLRGIFEEMIVGPSTRELVENGYLSFPVLYRPPEQITTQYHIKRGDFDTNEQAQVMSQKKIVGDVIAHYRKHLDGLPVIVSCVSVNHAHLMAEQFSNEGYRARAVWGDMAQKDREDAIQGLGDGSVQVVTFDSLIGEGVDIPVVAGVIMLRRTLSLSLYLQIVGRALRTYPGKDKAIILDHAGNYQLHGHVLTDRDWSLDSKKRKLKEDQIPVTTTCPKCYGIWPGKPRICPACGQAIQGEDIKRPAKDIAIIEGELIEAGVDEIEAGGVAGFVARAMEADPKLRQKMLLGKAFELAVKGDKGRLELEALAGFVGYKSGWTHWAWSYASRGRRGA